MAREVTLEELKRRARNMADMSTDGGGDGFIGDEELTDLINESYRELYDVIIQSFGNYYTAEDTITTVPGTQNYDLPDDFYKLIAFDMSSGAGYITMFPFDEIERNASLTTETSIPAATVRIRYVPVPVDLVDDADTILGHNGWEALLIVDVAIKMLDKEETNTDRLELRRQREMRRVQELSQNRDLLMPGRVTDITTSNAAFIVGPNLRYRFYGDTVTFVSVLYTGI